MIQRTTIAAEQDVLATLRAEAKRRRMSLASLVGEILAGRALELRRSRRPRVGVGRSASGTSQASVDHEDLPAAR